jgi:hypothetical protein
MKKKKRDETESEILDFQKIISGFIEIDISRLDEEWVKHPKMVQKCATFVADAKQRHSEAKAQLEIGEAEIKQEIRRDPAKFGIEKSTEGQFNEVMTTQEQYRKLLNKVNKAKYHVDILDGLMVALDHRKRALENLVSLHGQSYFSVPKTKAGTPMSVAPSKPKNKGK